MMTPQPAARSVTGLPALTSPFPLIPALPGLCGGCQGRRRSGASCTVPGRKRPMSFCRTWAARPTAIGHPEKAKTPWAIAQALCIWRWNRTAHLIPARASPTRKLPDWPTGLRTRLDVPQPAPASARPCLRRPATERPSRPSKSCGPPAGWRGRGRCRCRRR